MKYVHNSRSSLTLESLLRRRRKTLAGWLKEVGISTWASLEERCTRMGVTPPSRASFDAAAPAGDITAPTEGVVVLVPPPEGAPSEPSVDVIILDPPSDPAPLGAGKKKRRGSRA